MVLLTVLMDFKLAIRASMRVRLVQMAVRCKLLANEGCDDVDDDEAVRKRGVSKRCYFANQEKMKLMDYCLSEII